MSLWIVFSFRAQREHSDSVESQNPLRLKPSQKGPEKRVWTLRSTPFFRVSLGNWLMESTTFECTLFGSLGFAVKGTGFRGASVRTQAYAIKENRIMVCVGRTPHAHHYSGIPR